MTLNYPGDLTDSALVGERGMFPYLRRDGSAVERELEVTAVEYDFARNRTIVTMAAV